MVDMAKTHVSARERKRQGQYGCGQYVCAGQYGCATQKSRIRLLVQTRTRSLSHHVACCHVIARASCPRAPGGSGTLRRQRAGCPRHLRFSLLRFAVWGTEVLGFRAPAPSWGVSGRRGSDVFISHRKVLFPGISNLPGYLAGFFSNVRGQACGVTCEPELAPMGEGGDPHLPPLGKRCSGGAGS